MSRSPGRIEAPSRPSRVPVTWVYVDGFNFYYGALKGTGCRWLDLSAFCRRLLPNNDVHRIKYFTARVVARHGSDVSARRQQTYLRALATLPDVEVHFGHFLSHARRLPLADADGRIVSVEGRTQFATVLREEEKGSDVNLASHLVHDAHRGAFEAAVVISNDSDLETPISLVRRDLGLVVGVANPHAERRGSRQSVQLARVASFLKPVRHGALTRCQFPAELTDANGVFQKPGEW